MMNVKKIILMLVLIITFGVVGGSNIHAATKYEDTGVFDIKLEEKNYETEFKSSAMDIEYSVCKSGVYKLSLEAQKKDTLISVTDNKDDYPFAYSDDGVLKVYLEKDKNYNLCLAVYETKKEVIECKMTAELLEEKEYIPDVDAYVIDKNDKKISFSDYKKSGFNWNEENKTLTLKNCKIVGSIYAVKKEPDFKYDSDKIHGVLNLILEGNNKIVNLSSEYLFSLCCDLRISGKGKLSIEGSNLIVRADYLFVKDAMIKSQPICLNVGGGCINNAKIDAVLTYDELLKGSHHPYDGRKAPYDYVDYSIINEEGEEAKIEFNECEIKLQYELIPSKYLKKSKKYVDFSTLYGITVNNCKITIKMQKKLISAHKKHVKNNKKWKKITNTEYKYIPIKKSYRNGMKKGMMFTVYDYVYKVLKPASTDGKYRGKVELVSIKSDYDKIIPDEKVKLRDGHMIFDVVRFGKNCVSDKKELRQVTIKSKRIKKIGKNAFSRKNGGKIKFFVPKGMKKKYTKLLKKAKIKNFVVIEK